MKKIDFHNWKKFFLVCLVIGAVFVVLSGYLAGVVGQVAAPLVSAQRWLSDRVQIITNYFTVPRDVLVLQAENEMLKSQVSQLQTEVIQLQQTLKEADILYALLGFARGRPEETYVPASVIGKDPSPFMKYILIDQGSDNGIRAGMPVVTEKGLVGRVSAVTATAARVKLISDSTARINGRIEELDAECVIQGSITGDVSIEMVSQDVSMEAGMSIQTSGLGGDYPPDVMVGHILNVNQINNELFQSASIQPAEDFETLAAVLVVANFSPANVGPLEGDM